MKYKEVYMNLFDVGKEYALAHCISSDYAMGAGIAKQFQAEFPEMKSHIMHTTKSKVGDVVVYKSHDDRVVFNLVTKERYFHKPTYQTFEKSIKNLKTACETFEVKKLAIPLLGAGLDRLSWSKNKEIIKSEFKDTDIEILVCRML